MLYFVYSFVELKNALGIAAASLFCFNEIILTID